MNSWNPPEHVGDRMPLVQLTKRKPWCQRAPKPDLFSKDDLRIDLRTATITCLAGEVEPSEPGEIVHFDPEVCGVCLHAGSRYISPTRGPPYTRRVAVEHALAHLR